MEYLPAIATVALIHFLAVVSPGPDFIMVLRNSMVYSRKAGLYTALGLGAGIAVHVAYSLAGIALIISQSVLLFSVIKYLGAAYLIYVGIKSLLTRAGRPSDIAADRTNHELSAWQAIRLGFITNVTNPKATLFFLSLFTLVIEPSTPLVVKLVMGIEMVVATSLWFAMVAVFVSHPLVRLRVSGLQYYLEKFMGGLLILLGLKLAATHAK